MRVERAWPKAVGAAGPRECQACVAPPSSPPAPKEAGHAHSLSVIPQNFSSSLTCVNPRSGGFRRNGAIAGKRPMFDAQTTALLRAVLDEVCEAVSRYETSARTHVASMLLEAASKGETSIEGLKQAGRRALSDAPILRN